MLTKLQVGCLLGCEVVEVEMKSASVFVKKNCRLYITLRSKTRWLVHCACSNQALLLEKT